MGGGDKGARPAEASGTFETDDASSFRRKSPPVSWNLRSAQTPSTPTPLQQATYPVVDVLRPGQHSWSSGGDGPIRLGRSW